MERSTVDNLATIAIVPITEDVPLTNFSLELQHALLSIGKIQMCLLFIATCSIKAFQHTHPSASVKSD